jgi:hypothetical protein
VISQKISHFIEMERNTCPTYLGTQLPLNSGIRCAPVTGVENPFLRGMQSSEPSFILTSTGRAQKPDQRVTNHGFSESVEASGFRNDPFGLRFVSPHRPGNNSARPKILDRTACRNCQQLDRLHNRISNVTAWLYSSEPVLHLRIRAQHAALAQGTNTHKSRSGAATGIAGDAHSYFRASKSTAIVTHSRPSVLKLTSATRPDFPRNTMRAELALMALARESNRYLLIRMIAKATRKLHRPNTRLQDTMNDAFERVSCSTAAAASRAADVLIHSEDRAA